MRKINNAWIIDDDKILTYVLQRIMGSVDSFDKIEIFQNGKEAINHLSVVKKDPDSLPDLIILDINMPVMDGWQFLDEFEKIHLDKKITLYIVSSSIDIQDHNKAKKYKTVSDFLIKPIGKKQIEQMVASYQH
ncbi:response regulator [Emticicia sp. C21]|uniref:response regulator n=1 Tax=Emticicia sp. C21 TaxID=2302915 RepID=UPI000E353C13|nr:response regulator [Emticicia sp. C21]RFS13631.1 response regulator [Emticicia sp. C21]